MRLLFRCGLGSFLTLLLALSFPRQGFSQTQPGRQAGVRLFVAVDISLSVELIPLNIAERLLKNLPEGWKEMELVVFADRYRRISWPNKEDGLTNLRNVIDRYPRGPRLTCDKDKHGQKLLVLDGVNFDLCKTDFGDLMNPAVDFLRRSSPEARDIIWIISEGRQDRTGEGVKEKLPSLFPLRDAALRGLDLVLIYSGREKYTDRSGRVAWSEAESKAVWKSATAAANAMKESPGEVRLTFEGLGEQGNVKLSDLEGELIDRMILGGITAKIMTGSLP